MAYQQGQQIGNYHLDAFLEHGALADVFLGTHIHDKRQVTIRVFSGATTREQQEQIAAQVRWLAHLENPHILRLLDFGEQSGGEEQVLFMALEYASHGTLRQRHPQGAPLPLDTIVFYVQQIADGLQHAHERGILHRDIRPEHIFVNAQGKLQIDCSQRLIHTTNPGYLPDDVIYTPVEEPGVASDQYALATMVYEWLSGKLPFTGSEMEITTQRHNQAPPSLRERLPLLPPTIESVVFRAQEQEPEKRYARIEDFAMSFASAANLSPENTRLGAFSYRKLSPGEKESPQVKTVAAVSIVSNASYMTSTGRYNPFSSGFSYHTHGVNALAFSPIDKRIAFSCYENDLYLCDIAEQGQLHRYHHTGNVQTIAWSPDGQYLASISDNEQTTQIQIWEVATDKLMRTDELSEKAQSLQWSPDGQLIAAGGWDKTVHIWDPFNGETRLVYSDHTGTISTLAWSPNSARIVSGGGDTGLHVWEVESGRLINIYYGHFGWVNALAWSPDGEYIASAGDDQTIQIWHATTRERLFTHRQWDGRIMVVNWSPDGEHIVSGTWDGIVEEREASSDQHTFSLQANIIKKEGAIATAWRPDLSLIAFGGGDRRIEVADMLTGKLFLCRGSVQPVEIVGQGQMPSEIPPITSTETITTDTTTTTTTTTLQPGPAGPRVLHSSTRQSRAVKVWGGQEMSDMVIYRGHVGAVTALAWSPDSTRIASASYDGTVQVWDAITCSTIFTYRGHIDPVVTVAWSPNGQLLVSGSLDKTARVWDIFTGQEIQAYREHKSFVSAVTWSPDSKRVASGSEDGNIHIWDVTNGESIYISQEHTESVTAVAWSPDGRYLASGGEDHTVSIQETGTKQILFTYRGHSRAVRAVAWSPDSKHIASGSDWNRELEPADEQRPERKATIHIWSPTGEGEIIYCSDERSHASANALAWSPDGTMVAVTTIFSGAEVYDATTGEKVAQIWNTGETGNRTGRNLSIGWSPDGTRIAAGMSTGEVKIWPAG